jgi:hypothetical protein
MAEFLTPQEVINIKHELPYIYLLEKNGESLMVFGTGHTNDPKNNQLKILGEELEKFRPAIILVEGNYQTDESKTSNEAMHKGEMAYASFLAKKNNVLVEGWDISREDEIKELLKDFSREELFAFFVLRKMFQEHHFRPGEINLERVIEGFKKKSFWPSFDYSFNTIERTYRDIFKNDFEISSLNRAMFHPFHSMSVFNKIAYRSNCLRDIHCVKIIKEVLKSKKRVFVVMGSLHALMQEPVLREYFKK